MSSFHAERARGRVPAGSFARSWAPKPLRARVCRASLAAMAADATGGAGERAGLRLWWIAAGLSLGPAVSNGIARFAYGLLLPAMREDLGWSYAEAGWLNTANAIGYLAGAALSLWLIGPLGRGGCSSGGWR